ncbi:MULTISPECIES: nitrate/nitrite transporter [unclassified Rhodococcus (in: high G+C Gram-positive bacteria)]|uniref:MFS transporter n=1 Tax=unclassified Rhodococcus (in: high G+C Gram-positive bacteria) TaxID=192944 RepID=UPI000B9B91A7|nr:MULTISPECIES: MFS transporter [unclassified Rhodococcus (in: high G+C Gram-positive bacteria)]OZE20517.1 MFS transporter [Rhodococcus sp. 05-2254-6]OZE33173.1 MFS transporter [Rhodococcus sp. 05-2254-4]OZE43931.1 MFS transporter [Rhodococcus sp. 05-2254-3]OZE56385.1 MFS transporter [Rhodococcus sp. 05-2254-2]
MSTGKAVWVVWGVGVFAYIVGVLHRTSFGVAGLSAADRFSVSPSLLSSFVVLQVIVYAGMQIPAGVLLDRIGSRKMIAAGALIMASAQITLALTESLPVAVVARAFVGVGDALTFISVLRLVPVWFTPRRVPIVSQLTGLLGQLGQVLSAVPFLILLNGPGWTFAFGSAAALGLLALVLVLALVRDRPDDGAAPVFEPTTLKQTLASIAEVWRRPGTRLGFFSHMGTQFSITVFALLWGVPYLTSAQGLSASTAGALLTVSVASAVASGIVVGVLTGRYPMRRSWLVLAIMISNATMWAIVLALPGPAPVWLLVLLVVVISVGGPGSVIGFDLARTFNPSANLGTAQGMVNIGGFLASLLVIAAIGWILDAMGGYTFDGFRVALLAQFPVWIVAIIGVLSTRRKTRRVLAAEGIHPHTMREVRDRIRRK